MKVQVVSLKIKREKTVTMNEKLDSSVRAGEFLVRYIGSSDRENFVVIALSGQNQINCIQTISVGTVSETIVHPREVFKIALLSNASNIIIAHNHPAASLTPSKADIDTTKRIQQAGEIIGIKVLDHIIVNDTKYISFVERGLM